jgi:hypothetical protein
VDYEAKDEDGKTKRRTASMECRKAARYAFEQKEADSRHSASHGQEPNMPQGKQWSERDLQTNLVVQAERLAEELVRRLQTLLRRDTQTKQL